MIKIIENSDKNLVQEIKKCIADKQGYCCCTIENNKDTKCMCTEFKEKIKNKELGSCHCGLFQVVEI